jgi:hypothetical protein
MSCYKFPPYLNSVQEDPEGVFIKKKVLAVSLLVAIVNLNFEKDV